MLYRVQTKATPVGFDVHVQEIPSPYLWDTFCDPAFSIRKLDKILTEQLYSYDPQLVVYTYDRSQIEPYINDMKETLRTYLRRQSEYLECLLYNCK